MDVKILDSHLREYLDTKASAHDIAKYVSLCGPTFDRTRKVGKDYLYEIEVTTNRVDAASVIGIAREAAAILPRFGIKARLKQERVSPIKKFVGKSLPLKIISDSKLENRLTGIVFDNIKNWQSPKWMVDRLETAGMRSLNSVVDITNYIMLTIGHPCHAFDYDMIAGNSIKVRESKKGEKIKTLDGKEHKLLGGDIIFEDGEKNIIDLPGIMGLQNSVVSLDTKRVLLLFDNNDSVKIRRTSMSLGIRTIAATLNEKHVDPEIIPMALEYGVHLFQDICKADVASNIYDIYPKKYVQKKVETTKEFIEKLLGVKVEKDEVSSLLSTLEFSSKWTGDKLSVSVPSFRAHDISIQEDIVEEVARIYGYHNLPNALMDGNLPEPILNSPFSFEDKLRQNIKALNGIEILTYSLVSKSMVGDNALRLKNSLGSDTEYLRTTLKESLFKAKVENDGIEIPYHLFEIANIYIPSKNGLPEERMMLGGIFVNYDYRTAKGILETLFNSLNIKTQPKLGITSRDYWYEISVSDLQEKVEHKKFIPIPKYPPQIEDITIKIPEGSPVEKVLHSIKQVSNLVSNVELVDIYERNFTFRISYQHLDKTLSNSEVNEIREKIDKVIS